MFPNLTQLLSLQRKKPQPTWRSNFLLLCGTILFLLVSLEFGLFLLEQFTKAQVDEIDDLSKHVNTRILSIGESTTYGLRVNKEETYTHLLDEKVGETIRIFNLGIYSITSTTILRNFEQNILKTKPAIAILCIGNNDFSYTLSQQNTIIDPNFPLNLTKTLYKFRIYKLYKLLQDGNNDKNFFSHDKDELGRTYSISTYDESIERSMDLKSFRQYAETQLFFNLDEILKLAARYSVKLIFVGYFHSPANEPLKQYFSTHPIPFVQLTPNDIKLFVSSDGFHPSAKGHEYIAKEIFPVLDSLL